MDYKTQIKSGKWLRKRDNILKRDDYKCTCCGNENDLHVHHLYYERNLKAWEYDNETLKTVCGKCHDMLHNDLAKLSGLIAWEILCGKREAIS